MNIVEELKEKVLKEKQITKEEAILLYDAPLLELRAGADAIRKKFCSNDFDICSIINAKSGRCSEDCKYCAQSGIYHTQIKEYSLMNTEEILNQAKYNEKQGVFRYSIVTSGRCLSEKEIEQVCETIHCIREQTNIQICVSLGLLKKEQFKKLKDAGVTRIHNNLETSKGYFSNVCTTHTYEDKIAAIKTAEKVGLAVCSGGIMRIGETKEDRIDMALTLRELQINSIPINMLNPISGTPYEKFSRLTTEDMCRIAAVYRFLLPTAFIRLAGGRGLMKDKGRACFQSGANAAISGDMLTTAGITIQTDLKMLKELKYKIKL